ncbi:MAG: hypothetical protein ACRDLF_10310 [Solirubrobacteraceae bacterium]
MLAGLALAVAPPAALASSGDVAATQALARATNTLVRAAHPDIGRGLAAVKSYADQVAAQCPHVAARSPQDHDSEQLDNEVAGAMTTVGYHTAAGPIAAFNHAVKGLHWSNGRLTRAVRTFATKLEGLSTLATPDLCGDIGSWVSSGYATLPASTVQFDQRYAAVDVEAEESPLIIRLATPYATPSDFSVLRRVERFEAQLAEAEAHGVEDYTHLMNSIELNQ